MNKIFMLFGTIFGALSVAVGAFAAHGLKDFLEQSQRTHTFETAVKYQFYHTLALIMLAIVFDKLHIRWATWSGCGFISGIIIFSGSLYILCFTGARWWGAVTPIGGLLLIAAWALWAWALINS
ncbi:MAG: DUF423 domain-containing protein [Cytophagales bacterium]|nr:DUF423 domain-containing protein [Cytophagales bacterium]